MTEQETERQKIIDTAKKLFNAALEIKRPTVPFEQRLRDRFIGENHKLVIDKHTQPWDLDCLEEPVDYNGTLYTLWLTVCRVGDPEELPLCQHSSLEGVEAEMGRLIAAFGDRPMAN